MADLDRIRLKVEMLQSIVSGAASSIGDVQRELSRLLDRLAEPEQAQPRVWAWRTASSYDPDPGGRIHVRDKQGDIWQPRGLGGGDRIWQTPDTAPFAWSHVLKKWGPLTEVVEQASAERAESIADRWAGNDKAERTESDDLDPADAAAIMDDDTPEPWEGDR